MKYSKTDGTRVPYLKRRTYLGMSENAEYMYRPDTQVAFSLARVNIFETVPMCDLIYLMIDNQLPKCFIQISHDKKYPLDSKNLQRNIIRSIKMEDSVRYSGSKRNRKKVTTKLHFSEVLFTEHVLKRIYERSNQRNLPYQDLFFMQSQYLSELYKNLFPMGLEQELVKNVRDNIVYPFKSGVLIGSIEINSNQSTEIYEYDCRIERLKINYKYQGMLVFHAKTFYSYEMMSLCQKEVYNLFSVGEYQFAAHKMSDIKSKEKVVNKMPRFRRSNTDERISVVDFN